MYQTFFLSFCIFLLFFLYYVICCVFDCFLFVIQIVILLWIECGLNLPGMSWKKKKKKKKEEEEEKEISKTELPTPPVPLPNHNPLDWPFNYLF